MTESEFQARKEFIEKYERVVALKEFLDRLRDSIKKYEGKRL